VEAQAAREEAQPLGMMTWMQEREEKWEASHEDDKLCGAGIMNMIPKTMKAVVHSQRGGRKNQI
jgi:hypothetical protein